MIKRLGVEPWVLYSATSKSLSHRKIISTVVHAAAILGNTSQFYSPEQDDPLRHLQICYLKSSRGEIAIHVQVSWGGTSSKQAGFLQGTRKGMDVRAMKEYCLLAQKRLILYPREEDEKKKTKNLTQTDIVISQIR